MAEDAAPPAEKKSSPMKLVIVMIIGAILLVAVSMGGVFFLMKSMGMGGGGGADHAQPAHDVSKDPPIYFPLEPAFVVNFKDRGRTRFLQVSMQVMTRDQEIVTAMETHMPLIRNNILLVLSNQDSELLHSADGKEQIRQQSLEELKNILVRETGRVDVNIEGLYFTSFVTQ